MTKGFVMFTATRMDVGPIKPVTGAIQQEVRLFDGEGCFCTLLLTFPAGSPEWMKYQRSRTLDSAPTVRTDSIQSDAVPGAPA